MELQNLPKRKNRIYKSKRLGRGYGCGVGGHTVGRGTKGQKSRSGHKSMLFFEGGNVPFFRRMPKFRKFFQGTKQMFTPVNVKSIEDNFKDGDIISIETLKEKKLIKARGKNVKILGFGEIKKSVTVKSLKMSNVVKEKILAAKGKIE